MADYAHQVDPRMTLVLEKDVNRSRFMGYHNRKQKVEEDLARRTADRVAYNIQKYVRKNPNPRAALANPYVVRYAVHRVLDSGRVSMLVADFHFLEEAQEYIKNAMLGRMVFGGQVFDVNKGGLSTAGNLGVVGSATEPTGAVVGTKTMADGSKLFVRVQ